MYPLEPPEVLPSAPAVIAPKPPHEHPPLSYDYVLPVKKKKRRPVSCHGNSCHSDTINDCNLNFQCFNILPAELEKLSLLLSFLLTSF